MDNFSKFNNLKIFTLCCVLTFSMSSTVFNLSAETEVNNWDLEGICLDLDTEKLVKKVDDYINKDESKKITEALLDVKTEFEACVEQKLSISETFNQIKPSLEKIDKKAIKQLKKDLKKLEKSMVKDAKSDLKTCFKEKINIEEAMNCIKSNLENIDNEVLKQLKKDLKELQD